MNPFLKPGVVLSVFRDFFSHKGASAEDVCIQSGSASSFGSIEGGGNFQ